jgi:hypothetical protein
MSKPIRFYAAGMALAPGVISCKEETQRLYEVLEQRFAHRDRAATIPAGNGVESHDRTVRLD